MSNAKILVVDDSPTQLKLEVNALEGAGYEIVTAVDGEDALEKAAAEKPDMMVLDVIMPKLNGFQVCRKIKKTEDLKHIKILLCTSKNQESDIFWGKQQGSDGYIVKPFNTDDLLAQVKEILK